MNYAQLQQQYADLQALLAKEKDPEERKIIATAIDRAGRSLRELEKQVGIKTRSTGTYK